MKPKWCRGLLAGLLVAGVAAAAPSKTPLETARGQALAVHRALIAEAPPGVRTKITAAAIAARDSFARNPRTCNLHQVLVRELRRGFPGIAGQKLDLLVTLAFAETMSDMSQLDQVALQEAMQQQSQMLQAISNIMKSQHDTLKGIIQNLR